VSNVIKIAQFKKQQLKKKNKANTLCKSGFHKWQVIKKNQFDVKKGKLVTTYECQFCKKQKITAI
jgi:hypothetical protein